MTPTPFISSTTTASWNGERAWPVRVFRREIGEWKRLVFDTPSSNYGGRPLPPLRNVYSPVIPRKGCIILPAIRQKWSLRNETEVGTVIRRDDKILLRSKGRTRILLLQFKTLEDCLSFSDSFVALNSRHCDDLDTATPAIGLGSVVTVAPQQNDALSHGGEHPLRQLSNQDMEQRMVNGMVARLLHDKDFLRFVHKMETYIHQTEDGSAMLLGMQGRDLSGP